MIHLSKSELKIFFFKEINHFNGSNFQISVMGGWGGERDRETGRKGERKEGKNYFLECFINTIYLNYLTQRILSSFRKSEEHTMALG